MREMKDSGIGWIKEIPSNWNIIRGGFLYDISTGKKDAIAEYPEGKYAFFTCSKEQKRTNEYTFDTEALLVAGNGIVGYTQYFNGKFDAYQRTYVLHNFRKINPSFLKFYVSNNLITEVTPKAQGSVIQFIKYDDLRCFNVTVPPNDEQKRIAAYLDDQCKKIDEIMAAIQNQIDTLEDYKKSVISEAVTRGLDPDAVMKDSGIAFVGKIPANWELHPVYYYFSEGKIKNTGCTENNLLSLSYGYIIRKDINTSEGLLPASFSTYNIVEKDDIIIRPTDLQNDKRSLRTGLVKEKGIITSAYIDLKPKTNVNSKYFHFLLHSYDVKKVFYNMGNGVRQGLNFGGFSKLSVFNPPIKEQEEIAEYLDSKCAKIDSIIEDKKTQLETIENYKKSLIYEYVTGKKEVPENE